MLYPQHLLQNLPQQLNREELRNPYMVIDEFFQAFWLPDAMKELNKWFRSAFAQKSRLGKKESLGLLYLQEHLIRLLEAAQLLNDDINDHKAIDLNAADSATLNNTDLYYHPHKTLLPWDCFPRHLSRAEYANPYLVFEKCLRQLDLAGWRQLLKDLFYAAAYNVSISEAVQADDLYYTCRCLQKLLEACHLIKVREIDGKRQSEAA